MSSLQLQLQISQIFFCSLPTYFLLKDFQKILGSKLGCACKSRYTLNPSTIASPQGDDGPSNHHDQASNYVKNQSPMLSKNHLVGTLLMTRQQRPAKVWKPELTATPSQSLNQQTVQHATTTSELRNKTHCFTESVENSHVSHASVHQSSTRWGSTSLLHALQKLPLCFPELAQISHNKSGSSTGH